MNIQTTLFISGGLDSLNEKIKAMHSENFIVSAIGSDDGDFLIVFDKRKREQEIYSSSNLHEISDKIAKMNENGWTASAIASEDGDFLVVFQRELYSEFDGQHDDLNALSMPHGHNFFAF